ncbi:MAG: acyl-CoA dehydrogenase family protein [Halobacteriales archaeon]|nr:acyl-CoA dehydrogenase family protein [Halobacteriales archaeon]
MDFSLTDEQRRMKETVGDFFENEGGVELARRKMDGDEAVVDELWDAVAGMDYTALTVPVEHGGLGDGMVYLALFLEEAGRYAIPGPFAETLGFAVPLVEELGTDAQKDAHLSGIADGEKRVSVAIHDETKETPPGTVTMEAEVTDDGYVLNGTKPLVPYADDADTLVVATRTRDEGGYGGVSLFLVDTDADGVETEPIETLDGTRPLYEVEFDDVTLGEDALLGPLHGGGDALRRGIDRLNVCASAALVGGADEAVERSVQHGNEREQYGHPVGRFQAVKHRIADMWMNTQGARSLVYYAAWALENDAQDAPRAVASASAFTTEECTKVFGDDIFNHGGMGFTWDHDAHIFLKQARTWETFLGTPEEHRERVAEARL